MAQQPDEAQLLRAARSWDMDALAAIYDIYSPMIYRYAMRLLGSEDVAEECVAETFARFLQALRNGGGPKEHLRAYLYRVAHNWITDYYRRQPPPQVDLDLLDNVLTDDEESLGGRVVAQEEQERVRAALRLLTPEQRQVIVLRFLEELSLKEVAEAMQKPVGAVKALQHRALAALRRVLSEEEQQHG
ncbi:MAG: sigma-70 family RNA polymerase sigma factor [Chloroflexi bacterium]|nr:sigma-70 family RNA polymerase sigma factor [Chloroflexota bacterium]